MHDKLQEVVWKLRTQHQPGGHIDSLITAIVLIGGFVTSQGLFNTDALVVLCKGLVHVKNGAKRIDSTVDETMANCQWPMADGQWPMANGRWPMADGQWPMANGRWPMADGQWPMADGRWPMANGRWPMAIGRWPKVKS